MRKQITSGLGGSSDSWGGVLGLANRNCLWDNVTNALLLLSGLFRLGLAVDGWCLFDRLGLSSVFLLGLSGG